MHAYRFGMNFEETIVGKLAEVYQTVHLIIMMGQVVISGTPVGPASASASDYSVLMIVSNSELSQRNVPRFSTIVRMIGHTKTCLIIDEQWDGRSRTVSNPCLVCLQSLGQLFVSWELQALVSSSTPREYVDSQADPARNSWLRKGGNPSLGSWAWRHWHNSDSPPIVFHGDPEPALSQRL